MSPIRAAAIAALCAVLAGSSGAVAGAGGIRNLVLISLDTTRADYLSCYQPARQTTPNIDAVAREGVVFRQAYTTNPLTLPAHTSMLTGLTPLAHGVHDNNNYRVGASVVTLAEMLHDAG
ncbi:MAG TPA: sulfatase-like hydrolase/transferase, partial [Candidatus Eisenbacteria bacterium]|nr:sulfatase-like hydrolase/transferase [Candidatus Eisenbacteria bacterium]